MTAVENRRSETLSAKPQENTDFGSPSFAPDLGNRPRKEGEGNAEEDGDRRKEDITSNLDNRKFDTNDVPDPMNTRSPLQEVKVESDVDSEQPESHKYEKEVNSLCVNPSESQSNGAVQDELSNSTVRGLELGDSVPPPQKDEREGKVEQRAGISDRVNGDDSVSPDNGNLGEEVLMQEPDMNHGNDLEKENGITNDTAGPKATTSHIDNQASLANGNAIGPILTQKLDLGSPSAGLEEQTEHEEDPQSQRSHVDITSHASGGANSHRLPQTLVDNLPNNSTAKPQNDVEDKLDTENSPIPALANGHAIPQPSTPLPDSPVLENQKENSSLSPAAVEVRGIAEPSIPASTARPSRKEPSTQKRRRKRDILCSCFGEPDIDEHENATTNLNTADGSLPTAPNQVAENRSTSIPQPSRLPPNVPSPDGRPPNVPAPTYAPPAPPVSATSSHLAPERPPASNNPSAPSSLYDALSARAATPRQQIPHASLFARFAPWSASPTQSGSETDRDPVGILKEDQRVEELLKPSYNPHTKRWIAQFQENDLTYKPWNDLEKRQQLIDFTIARIGQPNTHDSSQKLWYADLLMVSKGEDAQGPYESVVLIGLSRKDDCEKLSKALKKEEKSDSWCLAGYTCRAEIGRGVKLNGLGSAATQSENTSQLLGTPIYGENMASVPTLCGQLCHIKGYNEVSGSLCTMGGVLHINQQFYVLTSAHPFRQETRNWDGPDGSAKEKIGQLSSFKLDSPVAAAGTPTGLASDWALISVEDQYIRPNVIKLEGTEKLIPITGYLPMVELTPGKVWVCTNRGPQLGALLQSTTIMGIGRNVFETRGILLEEELKDGDSGSWVVRNGKLCGFIIGRTIGEPRAYILPIERVFEEIREHLEATLDGNVSNPQTWLGDAPTGELNTPAVTKTLRKDKHVLQTQETVQRKGAQEPHDAVSVGSSRQSTFSQLSRSEALQLEGERPIHPAGTSDTSIMLEAANPFVSSVPEMPSSQQVHEPEKLAADASNTEAPPTPPPSFPNIQSRRVEPLSHSSGQPASDEMSATDLDYAARLKSLMSGVPEEPIQLQALARGEMSTEPVAKQDVKQKQPEKPPSTEQLQLNIYAQKPGNFGLASRKDISSAPSPKDDPDVRFMLDRLGIAQLEYQMADISKLCRRHRGTRGSQISQSIITEVVLFNDLMCQLLHAKPNTDRGDHWWSGNRWPDLLLSNVGLAKTELILSIVAEEARLIRFVLESEDGLDGLRRVISKGHVASVFRSSRTFVWDPTLSKLASNSLRLKSLVESQRTLVSELNGKNPNLDYDCTPQLELYKALELHLNPQTKGLSVGLALPKSWMSGHGSPATEILEFANLGLSSGFRKNTVLFVQWWSMEPDTERKGPPGVVSDVFERSSRLFSASIERIDGSRQHMEFKPIPMKQSQKIFSLGEYITTNKQTRIANLEIALYLSVGTIFLSPTPWYSPDSTALWEKVYFSWESSSGSIANILFVPSPRTLPDLLELGPIEQEGTPKARSILVELGITLIEIALRRTLSDDEKDQQRDTRNLSRSGLVAMEMGAEYQDIVNICFTRKYESNSGVTEYDESSAAFRAHANEAIIVPLRALWREAERPHSPLKDKAKATERIEMLRALAGMREEGVSSASISLASIPSRFKLPIE